MEVLFRTHDRTLFPSRDRTQIGGLLDLLFGSRGRSRGRNHIGRRSATIPLSATTTTKSSP